MSSADCDNYTPGSRLGKEKTEIDRADPEAGNAAGRMPRRGEVAEQIGCILW